MAKKLVVFNQNGEDITDEMYDEEWLTGILGEALKALKLDEIDTQIQELFRSGKHVVFEDNVMYH